MLQHELASLPFHQAVAPTDLLGVDLDQSPADIGVFAIPYRCVVKFAGGLVTETVAGSTSTGVLKFDKRPTAGSDASRGDGDIAELKFLTTAAGKLVYDLVAAGSILYPGQEVVVQLTTASVGTPTGHARPILVVEPADETWPNLSNAVLTT